MDNKTPASTHTPADTQTLTPAPPTLPLNSKESKEYIELCIKHKQVPQEDALAHFNTLRRIDNIAFPVFLKLRGQARGVLYTSEGRGSGLNAPGYFAEDIDESLGYLLDQGAQIITPEEAVKICEGVQ